MVATFTREQNRTARRLLAADGYLDLNMPEYAIRELDQIADAGAMSPSLFYLRGVALKDLGRVGEAIPYLEQAARMIPVPLCRFAWKSLSECYAAEGDVSMAELARMVAESTEFFDEEIDVEADEDNIVQPPETRPGHHVENNLLSDE